MVFIIICGFVANKKSTIKRTKQTKTNILNIYGIGVLTQKHAMCDTVCFVVLLMST